MTLTLENPNISDTAPAAITEAFKVDPFKGSHKGEVSRQWAARPRDQRFLSLSDMLAKVRARADNTREFLAETRKIEFVAPEPESIEDTHKLALALPDGSLVCPTHWSFGQLASLAGAPAGYLRTLPSQIVADNLNYGMRRNRETSEIKTYDVNGVLRAAVGPRYGWIKDAEVIEALMQIAGNGTGDARWKTPGVLDWRTNVYDPFAPATLDSTTLYASDRDMFAFLVDDTHPIEVGKLSDGSPDYMFRGFYITNSEVGAGSLKLAAFYLRAVCMNRNLWGVENFHELTIRHTSLAPARFIEEARPALMSFCDQTTAFWFMLDRGLMPTPDFEQDGAAIRRMFNPDEAAAPIELPQSLRGLFVQREDVTRKIGEMKKLVETMDAEIVHALGNHQTGVCGEFRISFKTVKRKSYTVADSEYQKLTIGKAKQ